MAKCKNLRKYIHFIGVVRGRNIMMVTLFIDHSILIGKVMLAFVDGLSFFNIK